MRLGLPVVLAVVIVVALLAATFVDVPYRGIAGWSVAAGALVAMTVVADRRSARRRR